MVSVYSACSPHNNHLFSALLSCLKCTKREKENKKTLAYVSRDEMLTNGVAKKLSCCTGGCEYTTPWCTLSQWHKHKVPYQDCWISIRFSCCGHLKISLQCDENKEYKWNKKWLSKDVYVRTSIFLRTEWMLKWMETSLQNKHRHGRSLRY